MGVRRKGRVKVTKQDKKDEVADCAADVTDITLF